MGGQSPVRTPILTVFNVQNVFQEKLQSWFFHLRIKPIRISGFTQVPLGEKLNVSIENRFLSIIIRESIFGASAALRTGPFQLL